MPLSVYVPPHQVMRDHELEKLRMACKEYLHVYIRTDKHPSPSEEMRVAKLVADALGEPL